MEIVNESIARNNENDRKCLHFSADAEKRWLEFYNKVESEMGVLGVLSNFKDYASKMAENMARIAALLHYFNGDEGDISLLTTEAAVEIIAWYVDEYIRLFSNSPEFTLVNSEADELYSWIKDYCYRCFVPYIRKNTILQYGPSRFRNRNKVNELLGALYSQKRILATKRGKTVFIAPSDIEFNIYR